VVICAPFSISCFRLAVATLKSISLSFFLNAGTHFMTTSVAPQKPTHDKTHSAHAKITVNTVNTKTAATANKVAVIMGSKSDWATMQSAVEILQMMEVEYHTEVVSAHRTPQKLTSFAETAVAQGYAVIIAGAGGAAHLPGMIAAHTRLPVLGVPVQSKALNGMDSLLSIVQMPKGIAVGTLAIGNAGAFNAGLLACQILALNNPELAVRLDDFRHQQTQTVLDNPDPSAD
jgi:5-(carboxyamino)imidazole ribonucleotide mutase